jgi:hypothetical protein
MNLSVLCGSRRSETKITCASHLIRDANTTPSITKPENAPSLSLPKKTRKKYKKTKKQKKQKKHRENKRALLIRNRIGCVAHFHLHRPWFGTRWACRDWGRYSGKGMKRRDARPVCVCVCVCMHVCMCVGGWVYERRGTWDTREMVSTCWQPACSVCMCVCVCARASNMHT